MLRRTSPEGVVKFIDQSTNTLPISAEIPVSDLHGDESGIPSVEQGGVDSSTFGPLEKKRTIVLVHICNERAFRRVHWLRARSKYATAFSSLAMPCMSCG